MAKYDDNIVNNIITRITRFTIMTLSDFTSYRTLPKINANINVNINAHGTLGQNGT